MKLQLLDEIAEINKAIGAPDLTRPVLDLINSRENTVYVAVLGQFKAGKSSFINSILGENILPIGSVPVTAIVTRIRFGVQPRLIIQFTDGHEIITDTSDLPLYITEKLNPDNSKHVAQAIVEHPLLEPYKNISLIDTPGLGSLYKHNTMATLQWLPFTGVAIVAVSAERPLSEEDINLIKGVSQYCPDVAIVITKTDMFGPTQMAEIKSYITQSLAKTTGKSFPVYEYSAITDTAEYRQKIIEKLILPLHNHAEEKLKEITQHKVKNILEQTFAYTDMALQAALKRETAKEAVNRLLQDVKNNKQYQEREMLWSGASFKDGVRDKLEKIILPYRTELTPKLTRQFDEVYPQWNGTLYKVSRQYEQWLKAEMEREVTEIDRKSFDQINQIVRETANYFEYTALRFRQLLDEKLSHELGVHLPETYWQIDFAGIDKPDIAIYRAFDSHLDLLLFFLPMQWFKPLFWGYFKKQITIEVNKNLHRYISDVTHKIFKTIDQLYQQALIYINNELKTVETLLQQTQSDYNKLQHYLERLQELKSQEL